MIGRRLAVALALLCFARAIAGVAATQPAAPSAPLQTGFAIYFTDLNESPGSIYRYTPADRQLVTIYTRPSGRIRSFSAFYLPSKLYFVNGTDGDLIRVDYVGGKWQKETVVYAHQATIQDLAWVAVKGRAPDLYISEAYGNRADGNIYKLVTNKPVLHYRVRLKDVGGYWGGDFGFGSELTLYLSSGTNTGAGLYRVDSGTPVRIYHDPKGAARGLSLTASNLYYASFSSHVYRVALATGSRSIAYSNAKYSYICDVDTAGPEPATPTPTATQPPLSTLHVAAEMAGGLPLQGVAVQITSGGGSVLGHTPFQLTYPRNTQLQLAAPSTIQVYGYGVHDFSHWRATAGQQLTQNPVVIVLGSPEPSMTIVYKLREPTATLVPSATSTVHPTLTATATVVPSPTQTPTLTATSTPTVVASATPTHALVPTVTPTPIATVVYGALSGRIILERRASSVGARVAVLDQDTLTDSEGRYSFERVPTGMQRLVISHPSYLRAELDIHIADGADTSAPDVTLLAGDVDQDGRIYLNDAALVALAMSAEPGSIPGYGERDVTDDGIVDIRDLVAVNYNWGAQAPGAVTIHGASELRRGAILASAGTESGP